jgi:hypothetical protein
MDMNNIAQNMPVETWTARPELKVIEATEPGAARKGGSAETSSIRAFGTRNRPEQNVLGWEIRLGRLTKTDTGKSKN